MKRSLEKNPNNIEFRNRLAKKLIEQGLLSEAYQVLMETISLNPNWSKSNGLLGYLLLEQGQYKEGVRFLEVAHIADPNDIKTMENLVLGYIKIGAKYDADKTLVKLLERDHNNNSYLKMKKIVQVL